ncbi:MAG: PAS domain S-box protein [Desulfamplus sp.]|nr:PAS domain S-box protein [Desulfamplus sp.]
MRKSDPNEVNRNKIEQRLREKAASILKKGLGTAEFIPKENVDELITELQMYHIELELQNEELRNAQKEIERSRDRFSALFNKAPVGYIVMDKDPMIIHANQTICEMLIKERSDLIHKPFAQFIAPEDRPIFLARFKAVFKNPRDKTITLRLIRDNGTLFHAELKARIHEFDTRSDSELSDYFLLSISDVTEREESLQRELHIKNVLSAIRKVNQLIAHESNSATLIQQTCEILAHTMGYFNAWIALVDEKDAVITTSSSGFKDGFSLMGSHLKRIQHPSCMEQALKQDDVVVIKNPSEECQNCPLSKQYSGRAGLTRRILSHGKLYGVLSVSVPALYAFDEEEQTLFGEMASDLGSALHRIEADALLHRLSHIIATIPHPMAFLSQTYRYLAVNDVYKEFYAIKKEEIIGKSPADFFGQRVFETNIKPHLDRCLSGEVIQFETEVEFPVKGKCWMEMSFFPYRDEKGKITGVVSHGFESTALKQSEKRLATIINTTPVGICITNEHGIFEQVNPAYCRLYKYDASELIGNHFTMVVPEANREALHNLHDAFLQGQKELRGEWEVVDKHGKSISIMADAARIIATDGRPRKVTFILDITEKQELEKLKEDVDRIMHHDLKQPLNAIMGFPYVLESKGNLDAQQLKILGIIKDAGQNMLNMIDSSLDMFKMETGKYEYLPQQVDALKVLFSTIEQNHSLLSMKKMECLILRNGIELAYPKSQSSMNEEVLTKEESLIVLSEKRLLTSLFSNLIVNAIEASPDTQAIVIEVTETTATAKAGTGIPADAGTTAGAGSTPAVAEGSISIAIHNKGVVPKEIRDKFFRKYETHGKKKGTGLGTYSAKLMANIMNYDIAMETSDETGMTCITVSIPKERVGRS